MPKTKESIAAYNKEYFARPEVIARAKIRNAKYRKRRTEHKKTEAGMIAEKRYRQTTRILTAKKNRLKLTYNITLEDVDLLKHKQGGYCAICGNIPRTWHIDHDHLSGKVRGMLCSSCNMALGLFHDDTERIRKAVDYLNGKL